MNQVVGLAMLGTLGVAVDVATDGREALERIARVPYDLAFMDCRMPGLDGFAATAEIRRREQGHGARMPVVALTANGLDGDRGLCLTAGMDDYLVKPYSRQELARVLARWLPERTETPVETPRAAMGENVTPISTAKRSAA